MGDDGMVLANGFRVLHSAMGLQVDAALVEERSSARSLVEDFIKDHCWENPTCMQHSLIQLPAEESSDRKI